MRREQRFWLGYEDVIWLVVVLEETVDLLQWMSYIMEWKRCTFCVSHSESSSRKRKRIIGERRTRCCRWSIGSSTGSGVSSGKKRWNWLFVGLQNSGKTTFVNVIAVCHFHFSLLTMVVVVDKIFCCSEWSVHRGHDPHSWLQYAQDHQGQCHHQAMGHWRPTEARLSSSTRQPESFRFRSMWERYCRGGERHRVHGWRGWWGQGPFGGKNIRVPPLHIRINFGPFGERT